MTKDELASRVLKALRAWHRPGGQDTLDFLRIVETHPKQLPEFERKRQPRFITNEVLLEAMQALDTEDPQGMAILRARFLDQISARSLSFTLNFSEDQVKRRQRQAVDALAGYLLERELELREVEARLFESRLPTPEYTRLFGVNERAQAVRARLLAGQPPWILALTGIGGIGKTALARFVVRDLAPVFGAHRIHWITLARLQAGMGQDLPEQRYNWLIGQLARLLGITVVNPSARSNQVALRLKSDPHLVVIDNLESRAETNYLAENLPGFAGPTRFLITSRSLPPGQGSVFNLPVTEMARPDAADFIRYQSEAIGAGPLAITAEDEIDSVLAVTGGNPLAIKLVVGLTARLPLREALEGLVSSRAQEAGAMYRHIYRKSWETLSPQARQLLQAMPLGAERGAAPDHLQAISRLPREDFWPAMSELLAQSLVEAHGTASERQYSIHQLTKTFLHTDILHIPAPDEHDDV